MKNMLKPAIIVMSFLYLFNMVDAQDEKQNRLTPVISEVEKYNGKIIQMSMKLRDVDYVMEKITFYDSDNMDVVFDISGYNKRNSKLRKYMRNVIPGALYRVRFTVKSVDPDGALMGELESFWPEFSEKIP